MIPLVAFRRRVEPGIDICALGAEGIGERGYFHAGRSGVLQGGEDFRLERAAGGAAALRARTALLRAEATEGADTAGEEMPPPSWVCSFDNS